MNQAHVGVIVDHLRKLVAEPSTGPTPDRELLRRFASQHDEAAFTTLVQRHGPMVRRVCQGLLHNWHDAEDVCQAVFLVLASKAASRSWHESVAGWLYQVAYHLALKAEAAAACRRVRESRAILRPHVDPVEEISARELQSALHEELARLSEKYRAPLVLCYLEGATRDEAARQLGWPLGTLKSRVERGRELLHRRLAARGLTLGAALSTALLATLATQAALPAGLSLGIVDTALRYAAGQVPTTAAGMEPAVGLARGLLRAMILNKCKTAAAWLLGVCLLAASVGLAAHRPGSTQQAEQAAGGQPPPSDEGKAKAAAENSPARNEDPGNPAARTLRVVVLDTQGKPLRNVKIHASVWTEEKGFKANHDYETDATGACQVELPKTFYIFRLWANKKQHAGLFAGWEQNELAGGAKLPAEYVFRLEPGVSAGGRIVDEQNQPIAGAKVEVMLANDRTPAHGDGRVRYNTWLATGSDAVRTDAEGRWRIDNVPDNPHAELSLLVTHPDYVSDERWGQAQQAAGITSAMLRQATAALTLKHGVIVRGRLTDPAGKPVKDALVVRGDDPYSATTQSKFATDADGRFQLPALAPGETTLTVIARGWAPQLRKVNLRAGLPPQDFRMAPGKPIRLRIVDAAGKPVPRAWVSLTGWKGSKSIWSDHNPNHPKVPDTGIPRRAGADGVWAWTWAPDDPVKLQIAAQGFTTSELEIAGGAAERTVTLKAAHRITGRVTDAVTGKPIPAFTVVPLNVFRKDWRCAARSHAVSGKDGRLGYLATRTDVPLRLRVEALGYRTQEGPEFRVGEDTSRVQDFRLQPSPPVAGVVLDAAGQPAAKAEVLLATPTEEVQLQAEMHNQKTFTDAAGRFTFPDPNAPCLVVAQADAGFALAELPANRHDAGILRLRPWAAIRGQFRDGGQPVRGATLFLNPIRLDTLDRPRISMVRMQTVTGLDGRFKFPRVPPIPVSVHVHLGPWEDESFRSGPSVPLDLQPGQRAELDLGSGGAVVTGRVRLTGKVPADLDCTYSLNYLVRREPGITPPAIARLGFDVRNGYRDTWGKTLEGQAYVSTLRCWFVKLAPDGAFRISGVPPGEYDLALEVYAKPAGCLVDPLARKVVRVTVTAADAARGELALPEITAPVVPIPTVGAVPELRFQRGDGTAGTLVDCRGRYTVVHFWASWCEPCKRQLPALQRLQERFGARGLAALSLSLDDDQAVWQAALTRLALPWPQGRLTAAGDAGVSSVPAYWLLDRAGKIVAKVNDPDELGPFLRDRLR
jgi:RNA polymerase sigma factor (sigma-70 family)